MKKFTKLLGIVLIIALVMSMGTMALAATTTTTTNTSTNPAAVTTTTTADTDESFTLSIGTGHTNTSVTHTYQAYQIFDGDLLVEQTTDGTTTTITKKTLSNIVWGDGVDTNATVDGKTLIQALSANSYFTGVTTAAEVAEKLDNAQNDSAIAQKFADIVSAYLGTTTKPSTATKGTDGKVTGYSISGLHAGYYLVKDSSGSLDNKDDFNTRFILQVLADETATPKGSYPSLDKEVSDDETEDSDTWYEAADHELYESFQFRLTATIPANVDLPKYELYKVVFTDTMSTGVTFESIESVKINNTAVTDGYTLSANIWDAEKKAFKTMDGDGSAAWTLTFADILTKLKDDEKTAEVKIEVIYNAHLNESATTFNASVTDNNTPANNKAKLTFSNNPNAGGTGDTGDTPEDTVWVFTYKVLNTKYKDEATTGNEFEGAGFTLYASDGTTRIPLYYDSNKTAYRRVKDDTTEFPGYTYDSTKTGAAAFTAATSTTAAADIKADLVSAKTTGLFNIIGLDEGTYVLKETVVPAGYNKCDDITINIVATTTENTSTTGADLTLTSTDTKPSNMNNKVLNQSGTVLPSTGGVGTTIFYVVGSILVVAAGVLLITKKRMSREG